MYSDLQLDGFPEFSVRVPYNYDPARLALFAQELMRVAIAKDDLRRQKETTGDE